MSDTLPAPLCQMYEHPTDWHIVRLYWMPGRLIRIHGWMLAYGLPALLPFHRMRSWAETAA